MKDEKNDQKKKNIPLIVLILTGLALGTLLKMFVIDIERISGTSMEPGLKDGSTIVLSKIHYGLFSLDGNLLIRFGTPEKGDIVYFWINNRPVIKRCVATEHEPLAFSYNSGYSMSVGGITIPLTEGQYQRLKFSDEVPEGTILAIGDNYTSSVDSREYGFVSVDSIMGKVLWQ